MGHSLYRGSCALSQFYSLCNFDATFLRGWSEARPRRYVFHSAKLPTIQMLFGGKFTTRNYPCIGYGNTILENSFQHGFCILQSILKDFFTKFCGKREWKIIQNCWFLPIFNGKGFFQLAIFILVLRWPLGLKNA